MNRIRRVIARIAASYKRHVEWYESLPPDVQAELLRNQHRML